VDKIGLSPVLLEASESDPADAIVGFFPGGCRNEIHQTGVSRGDNDAKHPIVTGVADHDRV
jgi:hypothetical protein